MSKSLGWSQRQPVVRWTIVAAMFVVALPLISAVHETAVLLAALALNWAATSPLLELPVRSVVADPIYARIALESLGNINAYGLAVSGPLGDTLHNLWPALFVDPILVMDGSWISAVTPSESSVISQFLVVASADGLLIAMGVLLVEWGLRGESLRSAAARPSILNGRVLFGLLLQARSLLALMSIELTTRSLESAGLAQIGTKWLVTSRESYESNVLVLGEWLSVGLHIMVVAAIYIAAVLFARLAFSLPRMRQATAGSTGFSGHPGTTKLFHLLPVISIALFASSSLGMAGTNFRYGDQATFDSIAKIDDEARDKVKIEAESPKRGDEENSVAPPAIQTPTALPGPSVVSIAGGSRQFAYLVNGKRERIRGVGYNAIYRHLSDEVRAMRYERDFARMADSGINTILGWDFDQGYAHDKFDDLLLAKASKFGLGVSMPYYLDPDGEYSDDQYRTRLADDVLAWVRRYKGHSAVRMWAIGNEVMHGMESMEVLYGATPKSNPEDFVDFYMNLIDDVHQEDPNHPVLYREAEDGFFGPFVARGPKGVEDRKWLVFGTNVFSGRLNEVLTNWERDGFDNALLVTEFSPTGLSPEDRPRGLVKRWRLIRRHACSVLGGIVYVWTTEGPEPIDRVYGLVDGDGNAVDGSLEAIAGEYRRDSNLPRDCTPSSKVGGGT
ncbi:MAG: hypothetical protein HY675_16550 [Chloroflexi bacterium]|nr:hypothetical protein [Chloroflexota bacterium]